MIKTTHMIDKITQHLSTFKQCIKKSFYFLNKIENGTPVWCIDRCLYVHIVTYEHRNSWGEQNYERKTHLDNSFSLLISKKKEVYFPKTKSKLQENKPLFLLASNNSAKNCCPNKFSIPKTSSLLEFYAYI